MAARILVTGGAGQVGLELARLGWPDGVTAHFPPRAELDLADPASIAASFAANRWDGVINCAAWTAVDAAEDHVADAFLANAMGAAWLAEAARAQGAPMVHLSTDYVFAGDLDRPYRADDPVGPQGAYGASKLAGEHAVRLANPRSVVLRTAWVLSAHRANFLKTMLRLGAERERLGVVADQIGCPTGAADIAGAVRQIALAMLADPAAPTGTYHFVNAGAASWFDLAAAIFAEAARRGARVPALDPIATAAYPTPARRPANSRLDCAALARDYGISARPWHEAVGEIVAELLGAPGPRGDDA